MKLIALNGTLMVGAHGAQGHLVQLSTEIKAHAKVRQDAHMKPPLAQVLGHMMSHLAHLIADALGQVLIVAVLTKELADRLLVALQTHPIARHLMMTITLAHQQADVLRHHQLIALHMMEQIKELANQTADAIGTE